MKKLFFWILMVALICCAVSVLASPPSDKYQLLLADEFSGDALDTEIWDWRSGNPYGGKNLKENVRVADGMLYLDYRKVDGFYTGGGVLTNFNLPYGYYETRAKIYGGTGGLHSSFWISGGNAFTTRPENYPHRNTMLEIDGFEIDSHMPSRLSHGTIYWWNERESRFREYYTEQDLSADYFVMGMEWLPDRVNFYVDGKLIGTDDRLNVYGPGYLWLTAVATPDSKMEVIDDSKADETGFFGSSEYDYFRYYQMPLKNENLLGNGDFEYDRTSSSSYPFCYILKGDTAAAFPLRSGDAYEGLACLRHSSVTAYEVSSGQEFMYLLSGNYTFSGKFKASGDFTKARMVIYGKDGNVIAQKQIPAAEEWISLSLKDIYIDGYAYVAIESASEGNTDLLIDNLQFYTTDGEEYTLHNSPDYLLHEEIPSELLQNMHNESLISYTKITDKSEGWSDATSLNIDNMWTGPGRYAVWEVEAPTNDQYRLAIQCLYADNNAENMLCTVWVNDGEQTEHLVPTNIGKTYYYHLGNLDLKQGDKVYVRVDSTYAKATRLSYLLLMPVPHFHAYNSLSFAPDYGSFMHQGIIYNWGEVKPYTKDGICYLPYRKLDKILGLNLGIQADYIDQNTLAQSTPYRLIDTGDTLLLTDSDEDFETKFISLCRTEIQNANNAPIPQQATLSEESGNGAITYGQEDAYWVGNWINSSLGGGSKYAIGHASVLWQCTAPQEGNYKVQFRSIFHENSTPHAQINVLTSNTIRNYSINQKEVPTDWYDVGTYSLKSGENVVISLTNPALYSCLRAKEVRLVPVSNPAPDYMGNETVSDALVVPFENAETVGEWTPSSVGNSYTAKEANAKATFTATAPETNRYSVQIYSVFHSNGPSKTNVAFTSDSEFHLYSINQTTTETGWYEVANTHLNQGETVTVSIEKPNTGGYLRTRYIRLVPEKADMTLLQSDEDVILALRGATLPCDSVLLGEFDDSGILVNVKQAPSASPVQFTLDDPENHYKLFFWNDKFEPLLEKID